MLPTASRDQGNHSLGWKIFPCGIMGWEFIQVFCWGANLASSKIPGENIALSINKHSRPTMIITSPTAQKNARYKLAGRRNMFTSGTFDLKNGLRFFWIILHRFHRPGWGWELGIRRRIPLEKPEEVLRNQKIVTTVPSHSTGPLEGTV